MGANYSEQYTIPFYESDVNHHVKLPHLLSFCLQVSGNQSLELNISDELIFKKYNLVWVVTDYTIDITRLPNFNEEVTVKTEAISYNNYICYRKFWIYSSTGELLIEILANFVLLDKDSRKIHRILDDIVTPYQVNKAKRGTPRLRYPSLENPEKTLYHVRFSDIDMNGHVNNSKYLEWMEEAMGLDFLTKHVPKKIHLTYVKEVVYGTDIFSLVSHKENHTYHEITSEGQVNARAMIEWREK